MRLLASTITITFKDKRYRVDRYADDHVYVFDDSVDNLTGHCVAHGLWNDRIVCIEDLMPIPHAALQDMPEQDLSYLWSAIENAFTVGPR